MKRKRINESKAYDRKMNSVFDSYINNLRISSDKKRIYLIGTSDNVRQNGLILVHTSSLEAQNNVMRVNQLASPNSWSYSLSGGVLTLSETDGRYGASFSVVTLCLGSGEVYS